MPWTRTRARHNRAEIVLNQKTFKAKTIKHSPARLTPPPPTINASLRKAINS